MAVVVTSSSDAVTDAATANAPVIVVDSIVEEASVTEQSRAVEEDADEGVVTMAPAFAQTVEFVPYLLR